VMRWQWKLRRTEKSGGWNPQNRRSPSVQPLGPHLAPSPKSNVETRWRQGFQQGPLLIGQETKAQNEALAQLSRKLQSTEAQRSSAGTGPGVERSECWARDCRWESKRFDQPIQVDPQVGLPGKFRLLARKSNYMWVDVEVNLKRPLQPFTCFIFLAGRPPDSSQINLLRNEGAIRGSSHYKVSLPMSTISSSILFSVSRFRLSSQDQN
jgi:hypothetical protein